MAMPAWVSEAGVAGTWVIAIAAIWGERIRAALFKPGLEITLVDEGGEAATEILQWVEDNQLRQRTRKARYYHLRVTNKRRFPMARDVQLLIMGVEQPGPDRTPKLDYRGPLPLVWRHQNIYPTARNIGPEAIADLVAVNEDGELSLRPMALPTNFTQKYSGAVQMWVTVVARALECDSAPVRVAIAWSGKWEPGEAEMKRQLSISVSPVEAH